MHVRLLIAAFGMVLGLAGTAYAETPCESVRTDLTGRNVPDQETIQDLSDDAQAGNCDAAADLTRRARDAAGVVKSQCPTQRDLMDIAASKLKMGEAILKTPQCQD